MLTILDEHTYGCPRVTAALRRGGQRCGKNRVARLMRENRLVPRQKRKRWRPMTTESNHARPVAENWLARVPAPTRPDQVWVADITSIDTGEGWLYLAGLLDACTRRLVGWQTGETLDASLVTPSLAESCAKPSPRARPAPPLGSRRAVRQRRDGRPAGKERGRRLDEPPGQRL